MHHLALAKYPSAEFRHGRQSPKSYTYGDFKTPIVLYRTKSQIPTLYGDFTTPYIYTLQYSAQDPTLYLVYFPPPQLTEFFFIFRKYSKQIFTYFTEILTFLWNFN